MHAGVVSNPVILMWDSRTEHPWALHRPEYPHISPTFLSCPSAASGAAKKHIRQEDIQCLTYTRKKCYQASTLLSQHIVTVATNVTAPTRTTIDTTTAPPNAPPSLTHISRRMSTQCYWMSRHHCHGARRGTRPSNRALSNNERHPNCKKYTHTHTHTRLIRYR